MKIGRLRNSITFLLLALFITTKMAGLHVFSHIDEDDHGVECSICVHVNAINSTPAITPDSQGPVIENKAYVPHEAITEIYRFLVSSSIAPDQLFSRPPPFVL
ncbi:DUF2946 domain-containing protein [Zobellia roscoffensis]